MKRLYINYEFEREIPKEILKDKNVYTSEIGFIVVKAEYKKKFEKKYDIPLKEFSEWFTEKYNQTQMIHELIYEITEEEPLLAVMQEGATSTLLYSPVIIKQTLDKLYQMPDDKIIEYILNYKLEDVLKIVIKPFVMTSVMKKYQEHVRNLEAQYRIDYHKEITDL